MDLDNRIACCTKNFHAAALAGTPLRPPGFLGTPDNGDASSRASDADPLASGSLPTLMVYRRGNVPNEKFWELVTARMSAT